MSDTIRVSYLLRLSDGDTPDNRIRALQLEQSAELPQDVVDSMGMRHVQGSIIHQEQPDEHHLSVTIAWPASNAGGEITQLLNMLFGNISMKRDIVITGLQWEDVAPDLLAGPAWGIDNIRSRWDIHGRALSCTALKPMGCTTEQLADTAYRFALGGIDIIKDDHGLTNQPSAPFKERISRCVEAMDRAAQETGRRSRYFPNITTDPHRIIEQYQMAADAGADGVLLVPMLAGPAVMHHLARSQTDLPIMAHPAFSGTLVAHDPELRQNQSAHGFEAGLFYGALWRALGADFVIYPNTGGRFAFSRETCLSINRQARSSDLPFISSFPTPGGGIQRDRMPQWIELYGKNTTFLIGGSLYGAPNGIINASKSFMEILNNI